MTDVTEPSPSRDELPRDAAVRIVGRLQRAGYETYFAGGCVRDRILGIEATDLDVATEARPAQITEVFPRARGVGEAFGVMLVRSGRHTIEVATFRADGVYADGRRPESVTFTDAEHDALRRDFTINGLFEDPIAGRVIDYVDGRADIEARIVRAIGDPNARFAEDRLRRLRAVRFAARFGFEIDAATAEAIRGGDERLLGVSPERIGNEVRRMFDDPGRLDAARRLEQLDLADVVLGEPGCAADFTRLAALGPDADLASGLVAWLLDRGGASADRPEARAARWARRLVLSNREQREIGRILRSLDAIGRWRDLRVAARKRAAGAPGFGSALDLHAAVEPEAARTIRADVAALAETGISPPPLLRGDDLLAAGFIPGPRFSRILELVYDAQLEGGVADVEGALALARELERAADSRR